MSPVTEQMAEEKAMRQAEKELERQAKVQHMKDVKAQVRDQAQETTANMDAYVILSFDTWDAKANFMERFGYNPNEKFLKGEVFDEQVERID